MIFGALSREDDDWCGVWCLYLFSSSPLCCFVSVSLPLPPFFPSLGRAIKWHVRVSYALVSQDLDLSHFDIRLLSLSVPNTTQVFGKQMHLYLI